MRVFFFFFTGFAIASCATGSDRRAEVDRRGDRSVEAIPDKGAKTGPTAESIGVPVVAHVLDTGQQVLLHSDGTWTAIEEMDDETDAAVPALEALGERRAESQIREPIPLKSESAGSPEASSVDLTKTVTQIHAQALTSEQFLEGAPEGARIPAAGFSAPYPYGNLIRGFDGDKCRHQGIDFGGVGTDAGLGTPIHAIVRSEIVFVGTPEMDPKRFGRRDRRQGTTARAGKKLPRKIEVPAYGQVFPFTRNHGTARTGVLITTRGVDDPVSGYTIRYMHLAAPRPDLRVGHIVEAGEVIGILGATAVQESAPHLHLDMENQDGVRVDPAQFLGLVELFPHRCRPLTRSQLQRKRKRVARSRMSPSERLKKNLSHRGKWVPKRHKVKRGETLGYLAAKYGVRVKDILRWNKSLRGPKSLRVGQTLVIYIPKRR
jgi:murein DD-endopeptidase MepM/ murein hydrolase activator NlpD